jgi:hypothetical protein
MSVILSFATSITVARFKSSATVNKTRQLSSPIIAEQRTFLLRRFQTIVVIAAKLCFDS